ncbi:hypothetical protein [Candidatus Vampirococcus lugosii]|uniref:Uncharacterized protein n=1 Tax=Candidatus Vampirococcus lugosii TaxID=2789015 RepID=A0ABS5QNL2_9BACT|nr:hypothetical protein [Candidatus Vampirococcus lugosii]MBS8122273.1 hypothetical protein [Candidatus Vampirococcus lugosii]
MEFTRRIYKNEIKPSKFRLLRGALNFNNLKPKGGRHKALLGPEVPYVIPRILKLPTMIMVISQITLDGYLLSYFSDEKPKPGQLTSPWLENNV